MPGWDVNFCAVDATDILWMNVDGLFHDPEKLVGSLGRWVRFSSADFGAALGSSVSSLLCDVHRCSSSLAKQRRQRSLNGQQSQPWIYITFTNHRTT